MTIDRENSELILREQKKVRDRRALLIAGTTGLLWAVACGRPPRIRSNSAQVSNPNPPSVVSPPEEIVDWTFARVDDPSEGGLTLKLNRGYFLRHPGYLYREQALVGLSTNINRERGTLKGRISIVNRLGSDEMDWLTKLGRFDLLRPNTLTVSWESYKFTGCAWNDQTLTLEQPSSRLA